MSDETNQTPPVTEIPVPDVLMVRTDGKGGREKVLKGKLAKLQARWSEKLATTRPTGVESIYLMPGEDIQAVRLNLLPQDVVMITVGQERIQNQARVLEFLQAVRDTLTRACPAWGGQVLVTAGEPFDIEMLPRAQARGLWSRLRRTFRPEHEELVQAAREALALLLSHADQVEGAEAQAAERLAKALGAAGGGGE